MNERVLPHDLRHPRVGDGSRPDLVGAALLERDRLDREREKQDDHEPRAGTTLRGALSERPSDVVVRRRYSEPAVREADPFMSGCVR